MREQNTLDVRLESLTSEILLQYRSIFILRKRLNISPVHQCPHYTQNPLKVTTYFYLFGGQSKAISACN